MLSFFLGSLLEGAVTTSEVFFGVVTEGVHLILTSSSGASKCFPYFKRLLGGAVMPFDASVDGMTEGVT